MPATTSPGAAFKRQVVFRIGPEDWPLLEAAAAEHGSIQAAVLAGLRALNPAAAKPAQTPASPPEKAQPAVPEQKQPQPDRPSKPKPLGGDPNEVIHASDGARLIGLKTSTVSGYIRSGRIAGWYDGSPTWYGWLTTRGAVEAYRRQRDGK